MSNSLENFAQELRAKREAKNISLTDIYEKTRIDAKYLENIEKGDFSFIDDVYMRAFIRKYADAIDFSPEEAIKMYNAALEGKSVDEVSDNVDNSVVSKSDDEKNEEPYTYSDVKQKKNNSLPLLALLAAIVVIGLLYFLFMQKNSDEIIVEPKISEILEEQKAEDTPKFEVKKHEEITSNKIAKADSLLLKINASDTVWFRITIDNNKNDEFILNPSHSKVLMAESEISLLLGNAGGVELILNGKKLNFTGKKGEIRNINVDADGIHYLKNVTKNNE